MKKLSFNLHRPGGVAQVSAHADSEQEAIEAICMREGCTQSDLRRIPAIWPGSWQMERPIPEGAWFTSGPELIRIADGAWRVIRKDYACHHRRISSVRELSQTIRAGQFAWPGGYEVCFVSKGGILCWDCVLETYPWVADAVGGAEEWNQWFVFGTEVIGCTLEPDNDHLCAHCHRQIGEEGGQDS